MESKAISKVLENASPAAVGKIGFSEMKVLYAAMTQQPLTQRDLHDIFVGAGVFPSDQEALLTFINEMVGILPEVDVLAKMKVNPEKENAVITQFAKDSASLELRELEPYYWKNPWSAKLKGKKVLLISPFTETIAAQYAKREHLWKDTILPEMELKYIKSPFSHYLCESEFDSWKESLDAMKNQMKGIDFDVCLVGAGAWSLPLVVEAKRSGKIGIHLGGPLQILFGIKGGRWDEHDVISKMYNEHWVRPSKDETPDNKQSVEGGCYW